MTVHLGNVPAGSVLYIPFATYDANGASVTMTGFVTSDILVYKNGSVTQRSSTAGFTLLDTDGTDFDGITGLHGFSIDLSDNTDAGFYAVGGFFWIVVSTVTVSTQVVTALVATFRLVAAEAVAGYPAVDTSKWLGGTIPAVSVTGVPIVDLKYTLGTISPAAAGSVRADAVTGAVGSVTALATDSVNANALATDAVNEIAAAVKPQVVAALATDTYAEPAQGAPGATISLAAKINFLYKFMRNKLVNDGTTLQVFNDDTVTVDHKSTIGVAGATVTRNKFASGP